MKVNKKILELNLNNIDNYLLYYNELPILCESLFTENFTITPKGINIDGDIIVDKNFPFIPIKFNIIKGDFDITNRNINSLEGCPNEVIHFSCSYSKIFNLKYCPNIIHGSFWAISTQLKDLDNLPKICHNIYLLNTPIAHNMNKYSQLKTLFSTNNINSIKLAWNILKHIN
jgi:hypothetical protein